MTEIEIAKKLWDLLDDIDTLSDIIKPDGPESYKNFYRQAMELAEKRHKLLKSDGYNLTKD